MTPEIQTIATMQYRNPKSCATPETNPLQNKRQKQAPNKVEVEHTSLQRTNSAALY